MRWYKNKHERIICVCYRLALSHRAFCFFLSRFLFFGKNNFAIGALESRKKAGNEELKEECDQIKEIYWIGVLCA
jgi:hypothetical protein